jgi:hypothetical protein
MTTPNVKFPVWAAAESQPWLPENETKHLIDALMPGVVLSDALATPPAAPVAGACYIVAATGTGTWTGWDGKIAAYIGGVWVQITPQEGWGFWVVNNTGRSVYTSGAWVAQIGEAPTDGTAYARQSGAWVEATTAGGMYDMEVTLSGVATASQVIFSRLLGRNAEFAANFSGSVGTIATSPTATFDLDVQADGVSIGTVSIGTTGAVIFATVGGTPQNVLAGSLVEVVAPAVVDATAGDILVQLIASSDGGVYIAPPPPLSAYPATIFASGEDGTVLDPTLISSLWQDVTGTIPVTASGDPVALWQDQTGNGNHATQPDPLKRPVYRDVGGLQYIDTAGGKWLTFTTGELNFADISVHMVLQSHWTTPSTIIGVGHSEPRSSPWWRWTLFESGDGPKRISNTLNGSSKLMPYSGFREAPKTIGFDTVSGQQFVSGAVVSSFSPLTLTYPNSTTCLIGANSDGGEVATLDIYGVLIVDRGLSAPEVAAVDAWMQGLI